MVSRILICVTILIGVVGCLGCSKGVQPRTIKVNTPALDEARGILERYAKGAPVSSELDSVPQLIEKLREVDPDKATVLEEAFEKIKESPRSRAAIATETLKKL